MFRRADTAPRILVTDAGRGCAVAIIRSLGRRGWHVIASDSTRSSPGLCSRYASETLLYPAPEHAPREFIESLLEFSRRQAVDLIIPVTDAAILPLSAARDQFGPHTKLAIPPAAALAAVTDKLRTIELAGKLGVPTPRTVLVETAAEALAAASSFSWPIVLKPQASRQYVGGECVETYEVCYAYDADDLAAKMARLEGRSAVLLQEYFAGTGFGVELLMHEGRPIAAFQHQRLREIPLTGGASAFRKSVPLDAVLYDYSVRLLAAMDWTGLAMVEFKAGPRGAQLMEINGRVWGSLPLAVQSGVDFPAALAELWLADGPPATLTATAPYDIGVHSRNLELEILWIAKVLLGKRRQSMLPIPSRREGLKACFQLFSPRCKFDILSLDDPRPGFAELRKIGRKLLHKATARHEGRAR